MLIPLAIQLAALSTGPLAGPAPEASVAGRISDAAPALRSINASSALPAITRPLRQAVVSSPTAQPIREILVRPGQRVEKGDPIIVQDDTVIRAAARAARARADASAGIETARFEQRFAVLKLQRTREAGETGVASAMELLQAEAAAEHAQAALQHAIEQAEIAALEAEQAEAQLEQHTVRAPFDGIITRVHVQIGQTPGGAEPLFEIADLDTLEVEVHLPAADALALEPGGTYALHPREPITSIPTTDVEDGTPTLAATLDAVVPTIDPAARTVRCIFLIDNTASGYPAGFHVVTQPAATNGQRAAADLSYDRPWLKTPPLTAANP